ncbi:MAG: hypothetical protein QOF37_383 [Thermoleophilaceae bacterium]|nr:hypothetical protein [Thermoleophilaceae bacterium]
MASPEQFWARRLRWRLIGAWRWPLFFALTVADAAIISRLPPTGAQALFLPALFICSFANLFLIGAVAPWLARRIQRNSARATFPPADHFDVLVDRVAAITLVVATLGLVAAGLGNRKVVVADTDRLARAGEQVKVYVDAHAPPEIRRNIDTLNTHPTQEDGFFRMCVAYNDRLKAYCMFVDAKTKPPHVVPDRDSRPNGSYFRTP